MWPIRMASAKKTCRAGAGGSSRAPRRCGSNGTAPNRATTSCSATSARGFTRRWPASTSTPPPRLSNISSSSRNVVGGLTFARAEYESIRGQIVSDWKIEDGKFTLRVVVPPNTTATICVPDATINDVDESGRPAMKAKGVTSFSQKENDAAFEVGSGEYTFSAPARSAQ